MKNLGQLMKMAQQLQANAKKLKKELEEKEFTGSAGGGAVKVVMKGSGELVKVEIKEELLEKENKEILEELILSAVNSTVKTIKKETESAFEKIAGPLGGLF